MREKPSVSEEQLRSCLQEQYDLSVTTLDFLPLGQDTNAGVYRVVSEHGILYFLKAMRGSFYEPSCLVPRYLRDQGIASVVAPLPTKRHALWTQVGEWTVRMYPFIDGDSGWNPGMTDVNWKEVGRILKQIHGVILPPAGFGSVRKETFDPTEYGQWVQMFETQRVCSEAGNMLEGTLRSCWTAHQPTIHNMVASMTQLGRLLQAHSGPFVVCHADLHPGNIIRNQAGHVFMIDWDDVMIAPKERDFLFVKTTKASDSARQEISPFFQGYAETQIDWVALTYYLYERTIQDIIANAQDVFFRDDLREETKSNAVRRFRDIFAEDGTVATAFAAAAHIPFARSRR